MARADALNICYDRFLPSDPLQESMPSVQRIALVTSKMWAPGDKLTVSFIGGNGTQRQHAIDAAKRLQAIANLNFDFIDGAGGMIRIAFNASLGAWSYMGKDALGISRGQPTMNLGFDQPGTYTHEWVHAVGALHEHQSPFENPIKWNKPQVYHDLGGPPNNWDTATIDNNMFATYSQTQTNGTKFDPKSVMLYSFPATWTIDGFKVEPNAVLSAEDIRWLATKYPGRVTPPAPVDPGTPPIAGDITIPKVVASLEKIRDAIIARNRLSAKDVALIKAYVDVQNKDLATVFRGLELPAGKDRAIAAALKRALSRVG